MSSTLIGAAAGGGIRFGLHYPSSRELLVSWSVIGAMVAKIFFGAFFFFLGPPFWIISGCFWVSTYTDKKYRYSLSNENEPATLELLRLCFSLVAKYDFSISVSFLTIMGLHTILLLWWGVLFVGLMSELDGFLAVLVFSLLYFALYWITQLFHAILSSIAGACTMWYFVKSEGEPLDPHKRVLLYTQNALTSSLGSLAKGSLLVPPSMSILTTEHSIIYPSGSSSARQAPAAVELRTASERFALTIIAPLSARAYKFNRLVFSHIGVYGCAFSRAVQNVNTEPALLKMLLDETTNFVLKSLVVLSSGLLMLLHVMLTTSGKESNASIALQALVTLTIVYTEASLMVCPVRAVVDTLPSAFLSNPLLFREISPIIFHRYHRATESA
jgi:hypothetical protein